MRYGFSPWISEVIYFIYYRGRIPVSVLPIFLLVTKIQMLQKHVLKFLFRRSSILRHVLFSSNCENLSKSIYMVRIARLEQIISKTTKVQFSNTIFHKCSSMIYHSNTELIKVSIGKIKEFMGAHVKLTILVTHSGLVLHWK